MNKECTAIWEARPCTREPKPLACVRCDAFCGGPRACVGCAHSPRRSDDLIAHCRSCAVYRNAEREAHAQVAAEA